MSAGILLYRSGPGGLEVLLVHPGGPFWAGRDRGAWSIPKGEVGAGEELLAAARREFAEETAIAGDADPQRLRCNEFELEWPRGSGRRRSFPEVDRAAWFGVDEARDKLVPAQVELVRRLVARVT